MPRTQDRVVMIWIAIFGSLAVFLVVYGGFVRLTRSGLSIVEWNPLNGAVPPMTQQAWEAEFSKYQGTPEYRQINKDMTQGDYQEIFLIEWFHRLIARIAGLVFAVPFLVFLCIGRIPWKESTVYFIMGFLFLSQALMGWIMVSSGLVERPSVSHYLLAAHLLLAVSLIGLSVWTVLGHHHGFNGAGRRARWSVASKAALSAAAVLLVQITYGAFTAGLKAGNVSNTWPLMLGRWIPQGLVSQTEPPLLNFIAAPLTIAFVHRWLAVAALIVAIVACGLIGQVRLDPGLRAALRLIFALGVLQIGLGIAVVASGVDAALSLLHQFNAICLFILAVYLLHRLRRRDRSSLHAAA
ncbi:MAG: COX15/CtaA family protein [Chloroflexota bacterium]